MLSQNRLDPKYLGLLVIDIQNDFCHPKGAFSKSNKKLVNLKQIISNINNIIDQSRFINLAIFHILTTHDIWTDSITYKDVAKLHARSGICKKGSWGAQRYNINFSEEDYTIEKHRYSAFQGTNLEMVLRCNNIYNLLLTGVLTNVCVESTAREAFHRDFFPIVLEDCVTTDNISFHKSSLKVIQDYFGLVISSKSAFNIWKDHYKSNISTKLTQY